MLRLTLLLAIVLTVSTWKQTTKHYIGVYIHMNTLDIIINGTPNAIIGQGIKGARGKRSSQRADESFAQYQERLRCARMEQAEALRAKRAKNRLKVANRAMAMLSANVAEKTAILANPVLVDPTLANVYRLFETSGVKAPAIRNSTLETLTQTDAVVRSALAVKLGKHERSDIIASLTMKFKGFSKIQGKKDVFLGEASFRRIHQSERAYNNMLRFKHASNSEPFCNMVPSPVSVLFIGPLTRDAVERPMLPAVPHTPRFEPSSLEVFCLEDRMGVKVHTLPRSSDGMLETSYVDGRIGGVWPESAKLERARYADANKRSLSDKATRILVKVLPTSKPLTVSDCAYMPIYSYPRRSHCYAND